MTVEDDFATVAARYAREQEQYRAMHLRGIQDQERQQAMQRQKHRPAMANQSFNSVPPPDQQHIQHASIQQATAQQYAIHPQQQNRLIGDVQGSPMPLSSINVQPPSANDQYDLSNSIGDAIRNGPHIRGDPQSSMQQQQQMATNEEPRQMLWGPDGADYLPTDSMFLKWGLRALPPNLRTPYHPPPVDMPITPCWYLMKKMEEKGLFYGHNVNLYGIPELVPQQIPEGQLLPPFAANVIPPTENGHHMISNGFVDQNVQQRPTVQSFSQPPPLLDFSRPPPTSMIAPTSIPPPIFSQAPPSSMMSQPPPSLFAVTSSLPEQIPPLQFNIPPPFHV